MAKAHPGCPPLLGLVRGSVGQSRGCCASADQKKLGLLLGDSSGEHGHKKKARQAAARTRSVSAGQESSGRCCCCSRGLVWRAAAFRPGCCSGARPARAWAKARAAAWIRLASGGQGPGCCCSDSSRGCRASARTRLATVGHAARTRFRV